MKNMMMDIRMRKNWSLSILSSAMSISLFRLLFSRVSMMDLRLKFDMLVTNCDNSDDSMLWAVDCSTDKMQLTDKSTIFIGEPVRGQLTWRWDALCKFQNKFWNNFLKNYLKYWLAPPCSLLIKFIGLCSTILACNVLNVVTRKILWTRSGLFLQ